MGKRRPLLIAGPTAVGKTELACALALELDGEILSVDSMQVYRGMDIGTAKPSLLQRAQVRHHLLDVADLTESFDAAQFVAQARSALDGLESRGRLPILCGGTGLYFQALLYGIGDAPAPDLELRAQLQTLPLEALLEELARVDPACFATIDRANRRRVVRAVEVCRLTGRPFSGQRALWRPPEPGRPAGLIAPVLIGLSRTREDLCGRIDARVDAMFAQGLVDEVKGLIERGLKENRTALQALGYRQVVEHLADRSSLAETIALVKLRTRQYAKRQMTWFRRQLALDWVPLAAAGSPADVVSDILRRYALAVRNGHEPDSGVAP